MRGSPPTHLAHPDHDLVRRSVLQDPVLNNKLVLLSGSAAWVVLTRSELSKVEILGLPNKKTLLSAEMALSPQALNGSLAEGTSDHVEPRSEEISVEAISFPPVTRRI